MWLYEASDRDSGRLKLVFESPDRELLDMPDNICVDPKSSNLYLCEDSDYVGSGGTEENYVRILTPDGRIADFAKNILTGYEETEVAGASRACQNIVASKPSRSVASLGSVVPASPT